MKRSEMLKQLEYTIRGSNGYTGPVDYYLNSELMAKDILETIETLGMMPPTVTITDPGHFPGDSFQYTIKGWEEE